MILTSSKDRFLFFVIINWLTKSVEYIEQGLLNLLHDAFGIGVACGCFIKGSVMFE